MSIESSERNTHQMILEITHTACISERGNWMTEYSAIADVSQLLIQEMQSVLVPDVVTSNDKIGLCLPAEHNDISLGIFLYDIMESEEIRRSSMITSGIHNRTVTLKIIWNKAFDQLFTVKRTNTTENVTNTMGTISKLVKFNQ